MPRSTRIAFGGVPLHVIQRGNDRKPCFVAEEDFPLYLTYLRDAATRTGCAIHAYVLMPNHVHLLLTPRDARGVSRLMQQLGRRYVRKFNERHGRTGTLWEGRFRSSVIDSERYFLVCQRYIEQNPVRAGLVCEARDYPWSSHRHYLDGLEDPLVTEHECFLRTGQTASERRGAYRRLFSEDANDEIVDYLRAAIHRGQTLGRRGHGPGTRAPESAASQLPGQSG